MGLSDVDARDDVVSADRALVVGALNLRVARVAQHGVPARCQEDGERCVHANAARVFLDVLLLRGTQVPRLDRSAHVAPIVLRDMRVMNG